MERSDLFQNFWDLSWKEKQVFVCSHVEVRKPKEKKEGNSRRNYSFRYFLNLSGKQVKVCKQFFCTTLCLKEWTVHTWAKKKCLPHDEGTDDEFNNATVPMNEGRDSDEEDLDEPEERVTEKKCFLLQWFDMLQKLPSHYCRKDTKKLYLEERWKNKTDLYETYKAFAAEQNKSAVSRTFFCQVFHQLNLSIFSPKKDQCNKCVGHKSGNVSQKEWEQHILDKDRARIEKDSDKSRALRKDIICLCMDLQAVKVSPLTNASAMYYKTKLCSHNFTVYNLSSRHCCCFWFNETEADLSANTYGSCIYNYLRKHCSSTARTPIVIYSNNCCNQNKNHVVANALLHTSIELEVEITQKYLIKGHTQMECDSVHAAIERQLKNQNTFIPHDYVKHTVEARKKPFPYDVEYIDYNFILDFDKLHYYDSIRPGKKPGDPVVNDIQCLKYCPDGKIYSKLNLDDSFEELPSKGPITLKSDPPNLWSSRLPIPKSKYENLQDLKAVIPKDYHQFYDNLLTC
ncbi:uncharacterized protein [Bemisia tabaci]|uniref:uncharacterized protein n=1 Tax=Bemisia tabaci TaxID=7038 RepID=UPI003B2868A4